tara:strand:+ start:106 stop:507 length:402 start_codon:yes stop_codon:yes gene_type:complete
MKKERKNKMIYKYNNQEFESQVEYIQALRDSDDRHNSYKPWTMEGDEELLKLSEKMSVPELANHFKRTHGAIYSRLLRLALPEGSIITKSDLFLNAVVHGAHPLTGEVLHDDSAWKHPQIIADISHFFDDMKE